MSYIDPKTRKVVQGNPPPGVFWTSPSGKWKPAPGGGGGGGGGGGASESETVLVDIYELGRQARRDRQLIKEGKMTREELEERQRAGQSLSVKPGIEGALKKAGVSEKVTPREVSLAPEKRFGEGFPILGASFSAIQGALGNLIKDTPFAGEAITTGEEAFPGGSMTPETLREVALREISIESFNEGISLSESVGSLIESIPLVGSFANNYASGLTQTPSANAQTVLSEIDKIKEAASTGQEKVRNGLEDPDYGMDRARSMEEDIAKLEGRIKLLISTSAQLKANTDEVNRIQEAILEGKEKVARYKRAASFGLVASLTGTGRPIPTDEQIFFELRRLKGK